MGTFRDAVLLLVWVGLYLAGIAWLAGHRRARAYVSTPRQECDYRADKDVGLRVLTFLLGLVLLVATYIVIR